MTNETNPATGTCALCHGKDRNLQLSHYLPRGVFRIIRDEAQESPAPIFINNCGVFQDSRQIRRRLLCSECEVRLNRGGENWFLNYCWRKNEFRLARILDSAMPIGQSQRLKIYDARDLPQINIPALTYFAASMFWRGSVCAWKTRGRVAKDIELGPYQEELRKYLLGESDFPADCALWISVAASDIPFARIALTPYGKRTGAYHTYKLVILGIGFHFFVGKAVPVDVRETCFVRGAGNPIFRTDRLEESILNDVGIMFQRRPQLLEGPKQRNKAAERGQ